MKITKNIWKSIKKPIFILAPMDDVTDTVFRQVVAKIGKPDLFFTEFTSVEGLQSPGKSQALKRLQFIESEKPLIAQIWGLNPKNFYKSAREISKMGFDGIDLNMGCPEKGTIKKGACSALINNPELAKKIIEATKKGAGNLPVSVKTRIGFSKIQTEEWCGFLLKQNIAALTVHGRTVKEMSKVEAHWDEIAKVVKLRDKLGKDTVIIGNGDVKGRKDGLEKVKLYKVDGIMIGRGIFHDIFAFKKNNQRKKDITKMLKFLLFHARLFDKTWSKTKNFAILRKFFKIYVHGFQGASDLRVKLMETKNLKEVEVIVANYLANL